MPVYGLRVEVHGEEQAFRLARHLIGKGHGDLARHLHTAMRDSMVGVEAEIRASTNRLPTRGGLAAEIATSRIAVNTTASASAVEVVVSARHRYNLAGLDSGRNVHPLFGNKRHWYGQAVRPRWFSDPVQDRADETGRAIERAVKKFISTLP